MPHTLYFSEDVLRLNPGLEPAHPLSVMPKPPRPLDDGHDSPLERAFHEELKARGLNVIRFDKRSAGWTFLLPGGVEYTPDFLAWHHYKFDPRIYEVKGENVKNTRESRAKFKIAAGLYPMFRWVWVTRSKAGAWTEKEFKP